MTILVQILMLKVGYFLEENVIFNNVMELEY